MHDVAADECEYGCQFWMSTCNAATAQSCNGESSARKDSSCSRGLKLAILQAHVKVHPSGMEHRLHTQKASCKLLQIGSILIKKESTLDRGKYAERPEHP